jgi:hypothetical protein
MRSSTRERPRPFTVAVVVVVALVPVGLLRQALRPIDDPDTFWHILSGQNVLRTGEVVVDDPYGRFSTHTWIQIDWLSDVGMAAAHHLGGYAAVSWVYAALNVVLFVAVYASCRPGVSPVLAGLASVVAWAGTYASLGFRPQTVSFILLAVTLLVWERVRTGALRSPWWLVVLTYVWACLHGLWILGPLVGFAVVAGLALDRDQPWRELARLATVPIASVAVAALTPIGPRLLLSPFVVNSYAQFVTEWRPPDIHEPYVAAAVLLLAAGAIGMARAATPAASPELLLWLMALGWTLLYSRTVAVGAVIAAPIAARSLSQLLSLPADRAAWRVERLVIPLGLLSALVVAAVLAPTVASGTRAMPTVLDDDIGRLPRDTVVLNDDTVGGWLLLEHPEVHPVIDTRTYLYGVPYIESYLGARAALGDWPHFLASTGATAALLREGEPLAPALVESRDWTVAGRGGGFVLLTAPDGVVPSS